MEKLLGLLGLTIGGWAGWFLGAQISIGLAIILSFVGTGLGLYLGRRMANEYF